MPVLQDLETYGPCAHSQIGKVKHPSEAVESNVCFLLPLLLLAFSLLPHALSTNVLYSLLTGDTSYAKMVCSSHERGYTPVGRRTWHLESPGMRQLSRAIVQSSQDPANRDLGSPCHIDNDKGDVCGRLNLPVQASPAPLSRKHRTVSGTRLKGFEVVSERVLWSSRCPRRVASGVQA